METTFQGTHLYPGLEGQRQWNAWATARATPVWLALFSLIAFATSAPFGRVPFVAAPGVKRRGRPLPMRWRKCVARWCQLGFCLSETVVEKQKPARFLFEHLAELLAYVT
jgi:hypothetical protein